MAARLIAKLFPIALLVATACSREGLPLDGAACPCITGYACCTDVNICVPEGTACAAEVVPPPTRISPTLLVDETPPAFRNDDVARGGGAAIADMDFDGDLDVAFSDVFGRRTVLFENDGEAGFTDITGAWSNTIPAFLATRFADFTGDGVNDFVINTRKAGLNDGKEALWLLKGREEGGFHDEPLSVFPVDVEGSIKGTAPIDLDGDGDLDLVGCIDAHETTTAPLFVALWHDQDLEPAPERVADWIAPGIPGCVAGALGDFDGDLDLDYVSCGESVHLFENDGGFFSHVEAGLPTSVERRCTSVDWVDFDGDGDFDIAYQEKEELYEDPDPLHGTVIYRNETPPGEAPVFVRVPAIEEDLTDVACPRTADQITEPSLIGGANAGTWLDADLDGDLDLFLPQPFPVCIWNPVLYENENGDGTRFVAHTIPTYGAMTGPTGVATGDIDADGDLEIVANDFAFSERTMFRNHAVENGALENGKYWLQVQVEDSRGRQVVATVVEMDLDGPNEQPDFANGPGKKAVRMIAPTGREASGPPIAHFGSSVGGPVWLRTKLSDGTDVIRLVVEWNQSVLLTP